MRPVSVLTVCTLLALAVGAPASAQQPINIDLNGNSLRDFEDFLLFAHEYGSASKRCDYDGSGRVDFGDFLIFVAEYRKAIPEREITVTLYGGAQMKMVWIEPGRFLMGSPQDEIDSLAAGYTQITASRYQGEGPRHEVTITRGFYIGKYELTQKQWKSVMSTRPWEQYPSSARDQNGRHPAGDNLPAYSIQWGEVEEFLQVQNHSNPAQALRLPTEAEWEYACRAGTATRWFFGDDEALLGDHGWYAENSRIVMSYEEIGVVYGAAIPQDVGFTFPNRWGLHDTHGNVKEWVQDYFGAYTSDPQTDPTGAAEPSNVPEASHVARGGNYSKGASDTRSAVRSAAGVAGLRVVMDMR